MCVKLKEMSLRVRVTSIQILSKLLLQQRECRLMVVLRFGAIKLYWAPYSSHPLEIRFVPVSQQFFSGRLTNVF